LRYTNAFIIIIIIIVVVIVTSMLSLLLHFKLIFKKKFPGEHAPDSVLVLLPLTVLCLKLQLMSILHQQILDRSSAWLHRLKLLLTRQRDTDLTLLTTLLLLISTSLLV